MADTIYKTTKLQLDQLLRIKEDLEDSIRKDENLMRKNNSRPKGEEDQIDFEETKRLYELKLDQLVKIKLVQADINTNGGNNTSIYDLSNLNRRKAFLNSLNTFEGNRTTLKSAGKEIEYKAKLTNKKVEKELKEIESGIRLLETELSNFNHSHEVTVDLYTELNLN
jgi:hypothetical protein